MTTLKHLYWGLGNAILLCFLGGDLIERDGKKYKIFYGMSSSTAMQKHAGGIAEYRWDAVSRFLPFLSKWSEMAGKDWD